MQVKRKENSNFLKMSNCLCFRVQSYSQASTMNIHRLDRLQKTCTYLQLWSLDSEMGCQHAQILVRSFLILQKVNYSLYANDENSTRELPGVLFIRVLILLMKAPNSYLCYALQRPHLITFTLGIRVLNINLEENILRPGQMS